MAKSDAELLLDSLRALHAHCLGVANEIQVILDLAERPSNGIPSSEGACRHPMAARVPAKAMGHPTRFVCQACGQTVEE